MKVLITGAEGMLGYALLHCLDSKHQIIPTDHYDFNICHRKLTRKFILSHKPELVIHAAAFTNVDAAEARPLISYYINELGTRNVAMACEECNAKLIYISTDFVFDGTKRTPYLEEDQPNPLSVYGRSKLGGERQVLHYCQDYLIVRTAWLYGYRGRNFIKTVANLAKKQKSIDIVGDQIGSPTFSIDLAKVLNELIEISYNGILHVVNSESSSWFELAKEALEILKIEDIQIKSIAAKDFNSPVNRPAYSVLDCSLLQRITGITLRPWQEALREYLSNFEADQVNL